MMRLFEIADFPREGAIFSWLLAYICFVSAASAQVSVPMRANNAQGTGANISETFLRPSNVNVASFGKLASLQVEGFVYAQPLVAANVTVKGKNRNLLIVSTMANIVYAFDADDFGPSGGFLWQSRLAPVGATQVTAEDYIIPDYVTNKIFPATFRGPIGIMGTPYIDMTASPPTDRKSTRLNSSHT